MDDTSTDGIVSGAGESMPDDISTDETVISSTGESECLEGNRRIENVTNTVSPPPLVAPTSGESSRNGGMTSDGERDAEGRDEKGCDLDDFSFQLKLDLHRGASKDKRQATSSPKEEENIDVSEDQDVDDSGDQLQWDFSLKELNLLGPEYKTICVSDKEFVKSLTKMNTFGECDHEPIKISCPCDKEVKYTVCFKCHLVFCSAKCARSHKTSTKKTDKKEEGNNVEPPVVTDVSKDADSVISTTENFQSSASSLIVNHGSESDDVNVDDKRCPNKPVPECDFKSSNVIEHVTEVARNETKLDKVDCEKGSSSPKSNHLVPATEGRNSHVRSFFKRPKESFMVKDQSRIPDQPDGGSNYNSKPKNFGVGLLPAPGSLVNMPFPVYGFVPPMLPRHVMGKTHPMPQIRGGTQPVFAASSNYRPLATAAYNDPQRLQQSGFSNLNSFNCNRDRDEGKVERNPYPRSVHRDNSQAPTSFRGARRGTHESDGQNKSQNRHTPQESSNEDLRFHERHASFEPEPTHLKPSRNAQHSPSKRCEQGRGGYAYHNDRDLHTNQSQVSRNTVETDGDKLLRNVQNRRSDSDAVVKNQTQCQKSLPAQEISPKFEKLGKDSNNFLRSNQMQSSRNYPEETSCNLAYNKPTSRRNCDIAKGANREKPRGPYSHNTDKFTGPSIMGKPASEFPKGKSSSSTSKIFQKRELPFNIPIMMGNSFGESVCDFFAFDSSGGSDIAKIEEAIKTTEKFSPLLLLQNDAFCVAKYVSDGIDGWYRARIVDILKDKVSVYFIDYGNQELVDPEYVCEIPEKLQDFYPAVINLCMDELVPNLDSESRQILSTYFHEYVKQEWIRVTILEKDQTPTTVRGLTRFKVRLEIRHGNVWINLASILEKEGAGKLRLSGAQSNPIVPRYKSSKPAVLDKSAELPILISNVINLNDFDAMEVKHAELRDEIEKQLVDANMAEYPVQAWERSEYVCAAKRKSGKWARAKIVMIEKAPNTVEVRFIDFGDTTVVPTRSLRALPPDMLHIPQLAFKCSLPVFPIAGTWPEEWITLLKNVAEAGREGQSAIHLFSKEVDPQLIYIVEIFTGDAKNGLSKTLLRRSKDEFECVYDVDLNIRHHV